MQPRPYVAVVFENTCDFLYGTFSFGTRDVASVLNQCPHSPQVHTGQLSVFQVVRKTGTVADTTVLKKTEIYLRSQVNPRNIGLVRFVT